MFLYTDFTFKALIITSLLQKLLYIDEQAYGNDMHAHVMSPTKTTLALFACDTCSKLSESGVHLLFSTSMANFTEEQLVEREV